MAEFSFHGHPERIDALKDELPSNGTSWDEFLLEAVRLQKRASGGGAIDSEVRTLERKAEITDELPDGEPDPTEYILECIKLRKQVEARELVLTEPDTRPVSETE